LSSILDRLVQWAERDPQKLLYAFLDGEGRVTESYTYAAFLARTGDIAAHIHRTCPLAPGTRVLLVYPPGLELVCAFFACVRLGLIPVPVYPPSSHGFRASLYKMTFIAKDCQAAAILTERSYYWSLKWNRTRHAVASFSFKSDVISKLKWILSDDAVRGASNDFPAAHSEVLFLQYTSGSTSDPKGVMVTHDNILVNSDIVVDHVPVGVTWLPQYHDMGLIGYYLFFAIKGGTTYGFSPLDFIHRPSLWLETITRYRATASSAPNFAYEYCLRPDRISPAVLESLDLSSLQFLMTAAEPVRATVYLEFLRKFEPCGLRPRSFFSAYGLAEFTLAVSNYGRTIRSFDADELGPAQSPAREGAGRATLVSCGAPLGTTQVRIVDVRAQPKVAPEGTVGEIWIAGPSKCLGYWGRPALSREVFEAALPGDPLPVTWLRTGDLGLVHDRELFICGRIKDLIIVRGLNYYPQDVEVLVEEDPAVRPGCVAAFAVERDGRELLVVVAELRRPTRTPETAQICRRVQQHLGITPDIFVSIRARSIPKTSSGKLIRHQVRTQWLEGTLHVVDETPVEPMGERGERPPCGGDARARPRGRADDISGLFHRYGLDGTEDETFGDFGFDSLRLAEFSHDVRSVLEAAGGEGLAPAADVRLLQKIAISELFGLLQQVQDGSIVGRGRLRRALASLQREHDSREQAMMRRDAAVPQVSASPRSESGWEKGDILLTGGTGFLGPFLIKSLLEQGDEDIYVLVRAEDSAHAKARLRKSRATIRGLSPALTAAWEARVKPLCGDLSSARLGLAPAEWEFLVENIHAIYHNGAAVNYLYDYATLRPANVNGTHEVVGLAMSRRPKTLNHISTTFVFGWSVKDTLFECDTNQDLDLLDFGYSQSKWVSEQIVLNAMTCGLRARIFRPALVTPSLVGGGYNFDISIRLLAFMLKHGIGTDARNQVSFCPVDVTANNTVAIAKMPESVGQTYHVTRDTFACMSDITEILGDLTQRNFTYFPLREFVPEVIDRCRRDDLLFPLLDFFVRSTERITAMEFKRYDNANYRKFRDLSPWGRPDPPLREVVRGILEFMTREGIAGEPVQPGNPGEEAVHAQR
jgi:thioester reductase-like protein